MYIFQKFILFFSLRQTYKTIYFLENIQNLIINTDITTLNIGLIDMQQTKIKINLSGLPRTSLEPLYGRAKISREYGSLFNDIKSVELIEQMDFDFSVIDKTFVDYYGLPMLHEQCNLTTK